MAQQTAIYWLIQNIPVRYQNAFLNDCADVIEQAKQMEKVRENEIYRLKSIIEFYEQGCGLEGCKVIEPHVH